MGAKGAAAASGTIGAANAYGSILPGMGSAVSNYGMLSMLNGGGYGGGGGQFNGVTGSMTGDPLTGYGGATNPWMPSDGTSY